jgi:cobalt-zinc-cadmium efflux system outer membrane protein
MINPFWRSVLVGITVLCAPLPARAAANPAAALDHVVNAALERSPEVQRVKAEVVAHEALLESARRLLSRNPEVEVEAGRRRSRDGAAPEFGISLAQPIEVAGQRGARIEEAEAALKQAQAGLAAARLEVQTAVVAAFVERLSAGALVDVAQEAVELATRLLAAARARVEAGDATRLDVNAQLVELGRARLALAQTRQRLAAAEASVRVHLGEHAPSVLDANLIEFVHTMAAPPEVEVALQRAMEAPALARARSRIARSQAQQRVAAREGFPTPVVGVAYWREGEEQVLVGRISVELPLFDRNQRERALARADVVGAQSALDALERRTRQEVRVLLDRHGAAVATARTYETELNHAAQESALLVEEAVKAGKLGLTELLIIQRNALETRAGYLAALEEVAASRLAITRLLGGS